MHLHIPISLVDIQKSNPHTVAHSTQERGRGRGKKRDTKFVTHILKWQLALVWRPMGNFWATNLCLETTLNGMLSEFEISIVYSLIALLL